jgi:UDP-N-acetylglucosamine 2-epimerase (non-hydrolysing)
MRGSGRASGPIRVLSVMGTRPEAIKMAPVIRAMRARPERFCSVVCTTGQHREMLRQVLHTFDVKAEHDLDVMSADQNLADLTARVVPGVERVIAAVTPELVLVQGDTTTTLASTLAAFYRRVPVGHIEAGLRSKDLTQPFPEEANRVLTDRLASFFFAPTEQNRDTLLREGVDRGAVLVTGNTGIDALSMMLDRIGGLDPRLWEVDWGRARGAVADRERLLVLITAHRRESFGPDLQSICEAIADLATEHSAWAFVYPVHLNPQVRSVVMRRLSLFANVYLLDPLSYEPFVYLMNRAALIMTDSGGIQEEAPFLGKLVVVMREKTERCEAVEQGAAILAGARREGIVSVMNPLMETIARGGKVGAAASPYGDGYAAGRILDFVWRRLRQEDA